MFITFGNGSKNGPIHNKINRRIKHDTTEAICVFPPTDCWIRDLDKDADIGMHEKNEPTTFPAPWNANTKDNF